MPTTPLVTIPARIADLRGDVSPTAPAGNQFHRWDAATGKWTPTFDVGPLTVQPTGAAAAGALASRFGRMVDVKNDFNAAGDDVADDYAACAAALAAGTSAGARVHFPRGTYRLSQALNPASDQLLTGDGWGKSILRLDPAVANIGPLDVNGVSRVVVQGLYLQGNGVGQWGCATFQGATDCFLVNCRCDEGFWGVLVRTGSARISLVNCLINAAHGGHGVEINGSDYCAIEGGTVRSSAAAGNAIELYQEGTMPLQGTRILGVDISSAVNAGIKAVGDRGTRIAGNYIHDCGQSGIYVVRGENDPTVPSDWGSIVNNWIDSNSPIQQLPGIYLTQSPFVRGWTINANVVTRNGGSGIALDLARFCNVTANIVARNNLVGVLVNQGSDNEIASNTIYDNGKGTGEPGILLDTSSNCVLAGNRITNLDTTNQYNGILFFGVHANNNVLGNSLAGNLSAGLVDSGTATNLRVRNNSGFPTEGGGTATVPSGSTSVVVAHGLARTPAVVNVTPTNLRTNNVQWCATADAANITITLSGDPGASGATFTWRAEGL